MSKEIFNEGRVVGYSAYELYIKQHANDDPEIPLPSEREWLTNNLLMGASMLVQLPVISQGADDCKYLDIPLPSNSILTASNTILGSFFDGEAAGTDVTGKLYTGTSTTTNVTATWATKITQYGKEISNIESSHPTEGAIGSTGMASVPRQSITGNNFVSNKTRLEEYMRIVDGVVLQPGTWYEEPDTKPPYMDFAPDFSASAYPTLRLIIRGSITSRPWLLLTGFALKTALVGVIMKDGSVGSKSPQNGDFLGPQVYPWANKIVFSVPNSYINYFVNTYYKRRLPADSAILSNRDPAVIDMKSGSEAGGIATTNPNAKLQAPVLENYYENSLTETDKLFYPASTDAAALALKHNSRVSDVVNDYSELGDGTAVITVYQKKSIYPPVLYGTFVDSKGQEYLHPIATAAPGDVKMFHNDEDGTYMDDYQNTYPGTTALNIDDSTHTIEVLDTSDPQNPTKQKVADVQVVDFDGTNGYGVKVITGNKSVTAVSLVSDTDGTVLPVTGNENIATNQPSGLNFKFNHISWRHFLHALRHNKFFNFSSMIKAGDGILTKVGSDGKVEIINAAPYDPAGTEWVTLVPGTHYNLYTFGGFCTLFDDTGYSGHTYKYLNNENNQCGSYYLQSHDVTTNCPVEVSISPSSDRSTADANKPRTVSIRFKSSVPASSTITYLFGHPAMGEGSYGNDASYENCYKAFAFRHSSAFDSIYGLRSLMFGVKFKNITHETLDFNLDQLNDIGSNLTDYKFYASTHSNVWNLRHYATMAGTDWTPSVGSTEPYGSAINNGTEYENTSSRERIDRASWSASISAESPKLMSSAYNTACRDCSIVIFAQSYSDGYNTQFSEYNNYLAATRINFDISVTLYMKI